MNSRLTDLYGQYAGWAIILLYVMAFFSALIASNAALPLILFVAAAALTVMRYWSDIKAFDFWALDEWVRTRYEAVGIAEWFPPYRAAELFCRQDIVRARHQATTQMNSIMMELLKDRDHAAALHADYDAAQTRFNQCNTALGRELLAYLRRGDLFAKGLLSKNGEGKAERIIPTARWRVMELDISKATASGHGWNYVGLVVGRTSIRRAKAAPQTTTPQTK